MSPKEKSKFEDQARTSAPTEVIYYPTKSLPEKSKCLIISVSVRASLTPDTMGVEEECTLHPITDTILNLIAGAAGGVACVLSGQSFDAVKVKMQTFPSLYRGCLDCSLMAYRHDGLRGLYQGSVPALLANLAENAVLFACYGTCQQLTRRVFGLGKGSHISDMQNALSGSLASVLSSLVLCPTDREMRIVGKTPLASHISTWSVVRDILKTDGPQGLFQGMTSTWLREVPGYFLFIGGYEICRTLFTKTGQSTDELGVPALYCGLTPTVLRAFPSNGALFLAYEWTRRTLINHTSTA